MIQLVFARCNTKTIEGNTEYAFGLDNGLPWGHIKQDMKNFAARTKNTVLVMGAKTFMSFQDPLPNRRHVVVCEPSRPLPTTKSGKVATECISMSQFMAFLRGDQVITSYADKEYPWDTVLNRDIDTSIIGGKTLIEIALPHVDKVVATTIIKKHRVNSDVQLSEAFINELISSRVMVENHWYQCDELTQVIETVYGDKREF